MKIALFGNTCNNNFSIMRYFHELGYEAHLFLYSNEGINNENPIHNPEWDSWCINEWKDYIHRLEIPNGIESIVGRPDKLRRPPNLKKIKKMISNYDYCIGSGITPSVFWRIGRSLDIFYPYSTGIEWVNESENKEKLKKINLEWPFRKIVYNTQIYGIKNTRIVINSCEGYTSEVLKDNNIKYINLQIPQYFNKENIPENITDKLLNEIIIKAKNSEFNIFSFMRQLWISRDDIYSKDTWQTLNKKNDWLIKGFKDFLLKSKTKKSLLFLSAWGPDIIESKLLIAKLEINEFIVWLPILPRRDISYILARVADIGVGEFVCSEGEPWGSTAWECLANGTPFIQSINYSNSLFYEKFKYNLPPFLLNVQKPEDVTIHLLNAYFNKVKYKNSAKENINWFNINNGVSLAQRYIELLKNYKK